MKSIPAGVGPGSAMGISAEMRGRRPGPRLPPCPALAPCKPCAVLETGTLCLCCRWSTGPHPQEVGATVQRVGGTAGLLQPLPAGLAVQGVGGFTCLQVVSSRMSILGLSYKQIRFGSFSRRENVPRLNWTAHMSRRNSASNMMEGKQVMSRIPLIPFKQ